MMRPSLPLVSLFVCPQHGVHAALISCSSLAKPFQDVGVDTQSDLSLAQHGLQPLAHKSPCKFLRRDLGDAGQVDLSIPHSIYPLPITPRSPRSSLSPHASSPFLSR